MCIQKPDERALLTSGSRSSLLVVPISPLTEENRKGLGVPVLTVGAGQSREDVGQEIAGQLPPLNEVSLRGGWSCALLRNGYYTYIRYLLFQSQLLEEMGLGPDGPPIQSPFVFSVVHCPRERHTPELEKQLQFVFVAASPDDPLVCQLCIVHTHTHTHTHTHAHTPLTYVVGHPCCYWWFPQEHSL